ncbi:MAG: UDP-N-acetylmuramate dehydrogenase [Rikenellaceae bacterium]
MIKVFNNISLQDRNSFHIDVQCSKLIEFESAKDLQTLFAETNDAPKEWMVLSGGNNILFTKDVDMTLLTPVATDITIIEDNDSSTTIRVEAGAEWDDVVEWCVARDLWGIENLSLIPGKAGAAPIQNIGAYGVEACDALLSVEYFDTKSLQIFNIAACYCQFAYRDSIFKRELKGRAIVTAIELKLSKSAAPKIEYADVKQRVEECGGATLRNIRDVICAIREAKLPDTAVLGNAGSFFKNPVVDNATAERVKSNYPDVALYPVDDKQTKIAAGWLIDKAGLKGYREGNVGIHERQALVLVNHGGASGAEVVAFSKMVQSKVKEIFGIEIESEVNIL